MTGDLVRRSRVPGHGRLLDLACGTGQPAFPLRHWFAGVRAVDQEPGMTGAVRGTFRQAAAGFACDVDRKPA